MAVDIIKNFLQDVRKSLSHCVRYYIKIRILNGIKKDAFNELKQSLIAKPVVASYPVDAYHWCIAPAGMTVRVEDSQLQSITYFSRKTPK